MRFVFATDENYWMQTFIAIYSLIVNHPGKKVEITILCESVNSTFKKNIEKWLKSVDSATVNFVILKESLEQLGNFQLCQHITKATYYRFFIHEFFSTDVDKVVYLDSDILINDSLVDLYEVDLGHHLLAAVPQIGGSHVERLGLPSNSGYFYAGVLVVNLKKWRDDNISQRLIQYSEEHQDIIRWGDQDCLNAIAAGQWLKLSKKFNFYHGFAKEEFAAYKHIKPSIIHYSGSVKPWHHMSSHPYKSLYWQYLRQTPYRSYKPDDLTPLNLIKSIIPKRLKEKLKA